MRREIAAQILAAQNVEHLRGLDSNIADPELVQRFEELTACARRGEIRGVVYTLIHGDENIGTGWLANRPLGYHQVLGMLVDSLFAYVRGKWA
jgi:hypothetical protein